MQIQSLLKIVGAVVILLALLYLLWPTDKNNSMVFSGSTASTTGEAFGDDTLVSAIQPIEQPDAAFESSAPLASPPVDAPSLEDRDAFSRALQALETGRYAEADEILAKLIARQPGLLEPYINRASAQASLGDLDSARQTLMAGLNANPNYGALYQNLQKVHAALAAQSYQLALSETHAQRMPSKSLTLPVAPKLNGNVTPSKLAELSEAKERVSALESELQQSLADQQQLLQTNSSLSAELESVKSFALEANQSSDASKNQIESLQQQLSIAEQKVFELEKDHAEELVALQNQLESQKELLRSQQVTIAAVSQPPEITNTEPADEPVTSAGPPAPELAIAHVRSWAAAWSAQDVEAYIAHYQENYAPSGSGLTHNQWREQRRVRLTNKRFIEVTLADFNTRQVSDTVVVNFVQRYRSNNLDDTIRKQLTLAAPNSDWSQPRIVSERVLR